LLDIYLPIADIKVGLHLLIFIGLITGIISGIFGLGGGLISVPFLTLIGISPQVAVATATNQMTAGTISSCIAYAKQKRVDFKLGVTMLIGGLKGNLVGIAVFSYLKESGDLDTFISVSFFFLLSIIGVKTAYEAVISIYNHVTKNGIEHKLPKHKHWFYALPFRIKYSSIEERISVLLPAGIGFVGGFFVLMLGIGGGFIMIPAMLYLLRADESNMSGTIQFQIIFTSIFSTILHALTTQNMDIVLCAILIVGTVIGAQIGARVGMKIQPKKFRFILAFVILTIAMSMGADLFIQPDSLYQIDQLGK
jgi:uncharacterized protein